MRIVKYAVAFVLVFCMLAVSVVCAAVVSDETSLAYEDVVAYNEHVDANIETFAETPQVTQSGALPFTPRFTAPDKDSFYYYSNKNIYHKYGYGMPNCTCYAWGRAYELLNSEPKLCIHDAHKWYIHNIENNYYPYGQEPKLGAIACFKYTHYDSGHVAVVEKITEDTIYFSNSAWSGQEFYVDSSPIDDPANGRYGWEFQGYIYVGEFAPADEEGDLYKITSDDGVNMRSGAGTSCEKIGAIPFDATVLVTKTAYADGYNWGYTFYGGRWGWFVTDFAQLITDETVEPPKYEIGDADLDNELTVLDAALIQMAIAKMKTLNETQTALADYDGDGQVSVIDSTLIRLKLAGK